MNFVTDRQTLNDLGIFAKQGTNSVYNLFNHTCTAGGAALLEEMFMHPLSSPDAINERIKIIQLFADLNLQFSFDYESFDLIEHYLKNTDERTKLTFQHNSLSKKLAHFLEKDTEYRLLYKAVTSLRDVLIQLANLLNNIADAGEFFMQVKNNIMLLFSEAPLDQLATGRKNQAPDHAQIAAYDTVFRFQKRSAIKQALQFIYHLDVYISIAKIKAEKGYSFAKARAEKGCMLRMQNVYHPLLEKAVPNSFSISANNNIVFLTGANMAGKSTFMKTVGISVFLAHLGFPAPADEMEFAVMDGMFTTINLPDNLGMGTSHFYAEVLRVKKVAKELAGAKNIFVIFDELFRGTNVKDAYDATIAIIAAFATRSLSSFIISTHIVEAGEVLRAKCRNILFLYLPTQMQGNIPVYPYTLESGITSDRHGMIIIRNEGILEILYADKK